MYCKIYIHSESKDRVVRYLEAKFGSYIIKLNDYSFAKFEVHFSKNNDANTDWIHIYPDGFLYYELIADIEIGEDYIEITDQILRLLWKNNIPSVAACDYEKDLIEYVLKR